MEAKLLAGVLQSDTHKRQAVAEELLEWARCENNDPQAFPELERLVAGLVAWMASSNFKVSVSAMDILCVLIRRIKDNFRPFIPTVLPALRERMGDVKEQVKEHCQQLAQQVMVEAVSSPQTFLDKLLEPGLQHKNWRVKEQSLVCLTRTLNYFGAGQVSVSKHMGSIVNLLGDANSQVRSCAMETIIEVYRHVGVKVRIDLSKRSIAQSRMASLTARFDAIDAATQAVDETGSEDIDDDVSSSCSAVSARTQGSSVSMSNSTSRSRPVPRPSSSRGMAISGGGVDEEDFEKAFLDAPSVNIYTQHDLEKNMTRIQSTLTDTSKSWELRVNALKELRGIARVESLDQQLFMAQLKNLEVPMLTSLKDLRSQVTKEACVTLSYLAVLYRGDVATFSEQMMPQLLPLLPNSAKVMATSAAVCIKFIVKNCPSHRLLSPLASFGFSSKSPVTRKQCAEFLAVALQSWDRHVVERSSKTVEELLKKGLADADSSTRKHCRKAYWGYHSRLPSRAQKLFDSLDPQMQRHLSEERMAMEKGSAVPRPSSSLGGKVVHKVGSAGTRLSEEASSDPTPEMATLQKALSSIANINSPSSSSLGPTSPTQSRPTAPAVRLVRPTVRLPKSKPPLRAASSTENILSSIPASPHHRPSSRSGAYSGIRPPSRGAGGLHKRRSNDLLPLKTGPGARLSRSHQPSPAHSRETSPQRPSSRQSSLPRRVAPPTKETMLRLFGPQAHEDEDDDAASMTSEKSTFSISSEISVSPYTKYPNPISDLNELIVMCSSQSWSDRRDGMAQLKMLLETPTKDFTHSDMQMIKAVFKRMFSEPQMKIYSIFLDTLSLYIEEHREYLDDWLFLMLLRLLHRHGSDLLAHMHYKLQLVLEQIRKSFDPDQQFATLCRILNDQSQPMGVKVRLAWLEYIVELLPLMESADFRDNSETRQAISRLLQYTSEPKSADVRRVSQKVVTALFDLNPATFSLMLRSVPKPLQEAANKILKVYMQEASSSDDEAGPPASPAQFRKRPASRAEGKKTGRVPSSPSTKVPRSSTHAPRPQSAALFRPTTPSRIRPPSVSSHAHPSPSAIPSPSPSRAASEGGLHRAKHFSSTPDVSQPSLKSGLKQPSPSPSSHSRLPTPSRGSGIPRRPGSTTPGATPSTIRRQPPPRAQSAMAQHSSPAPKRPNSARSNYEPDRYQNGGDGEEDMESSGSSAEGPDQFSFSNLPQLDYGSGDEKSAAEPVLTRDQMAMVLRELQSAPSPKQRQTVLQTIYTLARGYPEKCHWEEHFRPVLQQLLELMREDEAVVRALAIRILREMLKSEHQRLSDFAELTAIRVLSSFADSDATVSQAAEDTFSLLAPALPSEAALDLLAPMLVKEKYPMLLGSIKLLTKVATLSPTECLRCKLPELVPGLIRGYSHQESTVRKASVFCLVAVHSVVGPELKDHLGKLSSSQTKLLDLYIRRHQQQTSQQNGPH